MSDWSLPTLSNNWTDLISFFKNRDLDVAKGLDPAKVVVTNPATDMIRWNSVNGYWEVYNGVSWVALASIYQINVAQLGGQAGSYYTGAFTGDVTKGAGGFVLTISNDVVTFAKLQNINTSKLLGRNTAGIGDPEEIGVTGGIEFSGTGAIQTGAFTGDVTKASGGTALTIVPNAVTNAMLRDSAAVSVIGRAGATIGDPGDIVAAADDQILRRTAGVLSFGQLTVGMAPDNFWTYAKLQNVSVTDRILGRATVGAGVIEEIICTAAGRALLDDADAVAQRATLNVPTRTGGDASGTWGISISGTAAIATTANAVANDSVGNAGLANMATQTIKGRNAAGTGDPEDLTMPTVRSMLNVPVILAAGNTSNVGSVTFDLTSYSAYKTIRLRLRKVFPITDGAVLALRTSTNGGVSFDAGATDYAYAVRGVNGSNEVEQGGSNGSNALYMTLTFGSTRGISNNSAGGLDCDILLRDRQNTLRYTGVAWEGLYHANGSPQTHVRFDGSGIRGAAADVDALVVFMNTGNISLDYAIIGEPE